MTEHIVLGVSLAFNLLLLGPALMSVVEIWMMRDF